MHRFLSTIQYHPIEQISSCAPPPPPEKLAPAFVEEAPVHTAKIMQATEVMVDLLTLPTNILKVSPFTACQIATPTVALISACKTLLHGEELMAARERIRVAIAALDKLGEVWPRAAKTAKELKVIAKEVFGMGRPSKPPTPCISTTLQAYTQATEAVAFQEFSFLDDLVSGDQCEFSAFNYGNGTSTTAVSAGGNSSGETSMGSVTMAY